MSNKVKIIEKYLGFINGRMIVKIKGEDHDYLTKKIIHVDVIAKTLMTSDSLYVIDGGDMIITTQEIFDIYNDLNKGVLRFIKKNEIEKPNLSMMERYR